MPMVVLDTDATNADMTKATIPTTATIGKITCIKLAINPSFLPDSSDID